MKKKLLLGSLLGLWLANGQAQTLLSEDFETASESGYSTQVAAGEGWTTVNSYSGSRVEFNWCNYYNENGTINGTHVAACDGSTYSSDPARGFGPREEVLLTPELDLNDTYQLSFMWEASALAYGDKSPYDLQVRVVENGDLDNAETIFSFLDPNLLKESGVLPGTYNLWTGWQPYKSTLDLSDWKGKKVKIAFVYKMLAETGNIVYLDDVEVKHWVPDTTPKPTLSDNRYNFGTMYVGEKFYSTVFTLTNNGLNGLKVTGIDLPNGVGCTLDAASVNLDKYESVKFQLSYTASLLSPAQGEVVIHTNGGDVAIAVQATKEVVPEGFTLESFEKYFPPAGWKNKGWSGTKTALEGDCSAYASASWENQVLTSPRLDLRNGGSVTFSYHNQFDSMDGDSYQSNDFMVDVSYDGGNTWKTIWTFDYTRETVTETLTLDLGRGTDNSYVRWVNTAVESDDEGAAESSSIYMDRVLLPHLYGEGGVPGAAYLIKPADRSENVYPRDIVLEWGPAQFATGYKLYVGSNDEMTNLVDGVPLGDKLTYTIPVADYATTYLWRVVPYNEAGETLSGNVSVWRFTTQPDASVADYPYVQDFPTKELPTGWLLTPAENTYNYKWYVNELFPYINGDIKSNAMSSSWLNAGDHNSVTTQAFKLPAGKTMNISFVWGDEHPRDLVVDPAGLVKKHNVEPNNGVSDCVFEIFVDGQWTALTHLSENSFDGEHKYWVEEKVDLAAYAGKTVQFRWTHYSFSGSDSGSSIAHIVLEEVAGDKAIFNKPSWNAEKVNYGKSVNSGDIFTLLNKGINVLKVKSATFATKHFTTSLAAGDEIAVDNGRAFSIQFNADDANGVVEDLLTVVFESGYQVTFPVRGEGLAEDVLYYAFEPNPLDYEWKNDFTMIDVDGKSNYKLNYYMTIVENDGQRYAFTSVENNNTNLLAAVSGNHTIAAAAPDDNSAAEDWLISKQIRPAAGATFDFFARNLGTINSVFIGDNDYHNVAVFVSESGNVSTVDFKIAMKDTQMPYLKENEWNHFTVDLSPWADKDIYVAVRHTTVSANWLAFFDDFTFTHVVPAGQSGIKQLTAIEDDTKVEVYNANGVLVRSGHGASVVESLQKGFYIVKTQQGGEARTFRLTRK